MSIPQQNLASGSTTGMTGTRATLLSAAFVFACLPALRALIATWSVQDVYSYGYLVPVAAALWIWHDCDRFAHLPVRPALSGGLAIVLAGGLMLVLGNVGGSSAIQELAVVVIIPGLVLMLFGAQYLKALALPLAYLVLMVPFLDGIVAGLHEPLQLFAATIAVKVLHLTNVPVFQSGRLIELPKTTLEVANACSGVRFLISTVVLCIPLAFISQKGWLQRFLLILFAVVLSIVANPIRVTLVALWAYYGDGDIHGPLHIFQGYVVYLFIMGLLFAAAWYLRKMPVSIRQDDRDAVAADGQVAIDGRRLKRALSLALTTLVAIGASVHIVKTTPVLLKTSLDQLPATIGEWQNVKTENNSRQLSIPGADAELSRVYRNSSGAEIELQIAYFESQQYDKKLTFSKLQELQGKAHTEDVLIQKDATYAVRVNKTLITGEKRASLYLSWYDLNGQIITNRYLAKLKTALDGIVRRRTNGAVVVVSTTMPTNEQQSALKNIVPFVQSLLPILDEFIPHENR